MLLSELTGKKVCIIGFGREGQSVLRALEDINCEITVADANENCQLSIINSQLGTDYLKDLERFDVIIKSPGVPPDLVAHVQDKITNSTQIFLDEVTAKGCSVIGITGSKGKSTTASLIYEVLKEAGKDVQLVGNIGNPTLDYLKDAKEGTVFVQEMSSYQLMDLNVSPSLAVVTSFFPEHLDYHGTLEAYKDAKKHITRFQTKDDIVFYDEASDGSKEIAEESPGTKIPYSTDDAVIGLHDTHLIGSHNLKNIAAASAVAKHLGIDEETTQKAIMNFKGLPHRLQSIGIHHEIEWVDDAISTTPESTIAAIEALGDRVKTIILGGQDRGSDFGELAKEIVGSRINRVILFPESGERIKEALQALGSSVDVHDADSMEKAVQIAKEHTSEGMICLLSTASPSYNMFKNFEEKGQEFARCIQEA